MAATSRPEQRIAGQFQRIDGVVEMMEFALNGIREREEPTERRYHLKNFVLHCSSVTHVVQGLRSKVSSFDEWWTSIVAVMDADPLMRYFYKLRTEILKKNAYHVSYKISPRPPHTSVTLRRSDIGPPPEHGMTFRVTGDGPFWVLHSPAGREIKSIRALLPEGCGGVGRLLFTDCPEAEFPKHFEGQDIAEVCQAHMDRLLAIVEQAYEKYWPWPDQLAAALREEEAENSHNTPK